MRRARTTNGCGLVRLRTSVSSAWCCSFVNSMDAAANRAMLVSTSAEFIALQYRGYKLFRYPVLGVPGPEVQRIPMGILQVTRPPCVASPVLRDGGSHVDPGVP